MNKKILILLAVVWTAALGLVGFSELRPEGTAGNAQNTASTNSAEQETAVRESTARESTEQEPPKRQTAGGSNSGGSGAEGVTLQVGGEPGLEFSGRCTVDGEERELENRTPQTYTYEPEERLECEISSRDRGPLRVTFSDGGGTNTTQQVGPGPASLELTYTGNNLSISTSSSAQAGSSQRSSSQTGSSQISSSQSSSQTSSSVTQSVSE